MPAGALFAGMLVARGADAAPLPASAAPFHYTVLGGQVAESLRWLGNDLRIPVIVSDAVAGTITAPISGNSAQQYLNALASRYGLSWYFDGTTLYITNLSQTASQAVPLPRAGYAALIAALHKSGVLDGSVSAPTQANAAYAVVSGPPRYVEQVAQIARSMQSETEAVDASAMIYRGSAAERVRF